jgi:23S rRNA (cytidine1920-2'-O)/16S rRNA (cytidine1409-2'-O)-methyltransferase
VDPRVVVMERTNLRHLQPLPELVDVATLDLSFISVLKVRSVDYKRFSPTARFQHLIAPPFN